MVATRYAAPRSPGTSTEDIIQRLSDGLSPGVVSAVRDAADRAGGQVSARASMRSGVWSRSLSVAAGAASQVTIRLGQPFICTMVTARCLFPDIDDDSSQITFRLESPGQVGYLLGDADSDLHASVLAEISTPLPLAKPWLIWPLEELKLTATGAAGLDATSTFVFGAVGFFLSGFGTA